MLRCSIIDVKLHEVRTVVGIATDRPGTSEIGYSSDIVYLHESHWTSEEKDKILKLSEELGYFKNV